VQHTLKNARLGLEIYNGCKHAAVSIDALSYLYFGHLSVKRDIILWEIKLLYTNDEPQGRSTTLIVRFHMALKNIGAESYFSPIH